MAGWSGLLLSDRRRGMMECFIREYRWNPWLKNFMMRLIRWFILGGLVALLPSVMSAADAKKLAKAAPPPAINKLVWLAGRWHMEKGGRVIDEQWMAPAAGVMLGMARTVVKGKVVEHEFVQIREGPGGDLFYIAQPSGQKEAAFQLTSLTDTEAVFGNPSHDFPQKITYTLKADGSLLAAIEGPGPDGQVKRIEFPYQRLQP